MNAVSLNAIINVNEIFEKISLDGDKVMPEMHLKKTRFTYSAFEPFTKSKERNKKIKELGDTKYIYRNQLDKSCFQHDMAYGNFKYLARRATSDKVFRDKAFKIAKDPKCDGYQRGLCCCCYCCCFFCQGFLSLTLMTHRTAGEESGPFFIPLYHFHSLTNIQIFICNFACEMTITYF